MRLELAQGFAVPVDSDAGNPVSGHRQCVSPPSTGEIEGGATGCTGLEARELLAEEE